MGNYNKPMQAPRPPWGATPGGNMWQGGQNGQKPGGNVWGRGPGMPVNMGVTPQGPDPVLPYQQPQAPSPMPPQQTMPQGTPMQFDASGRANAPNAPQQITAGPPPNAGWGMPQAPQQFTAPPPPNAGYQYHVPQQAPQQNSVPPHVMAQLLMGGMRR